MAGIKLPAVQSFPIGPWDGGLNFAADVAQIADNETPDCSDLTITPGGGLTSRYAITTPSAAGSTATTGDGRIRRLFYSRELSLWLLQAAAKLYKSTDLTSFTLVNTFSTSAVCSIVDFNGVAVVSHLADGTYTYDGAAFTLRAAAAKGVASAVWQNKVWVTGETSRVHFCNAGDATTWASSVDLRSKDNTKCTAIGGGNGMDITGRTGLLVFKQRSTYRIHDSATGAYVSLSDDVGCLGPQALCSLEGLTFFVGARGIYATDGATIPELRSAKIAPLFDPLFFAVSDEITAAAHLGRAYFAVPSTNASNQNLRVLEHHPLDGWFMPLVSVMGIATFAGGDYQGVSTRFFGLPATSYNHVAAGPLYGFLDFLSPVYTADTAAGGGTSTPESWLRTKFYELEAGYQVQIQRLRLKGLGDVDISVRFDFETADGGLRSFTESAVDLTGPYAESASYADLWNIGCAKAVQFKFGKTGLTSQAPPTPSGYSNLRGALVIDRGMIDYVRLGLA